MSSKPTYGLLIPIMLAKIDDEDFGTAKLVESFGQDALQTDKFRHVKAAGLLVRERISNFLSAGILAKCENLTDLTLNAFNAAMLKDAFGKPFANLKRLEINVLDSFEITDDLMFNLPGLETLVVNCTLLAGLLDAISRGAPSLKHFDADLYPVPTAPAPSPLIPASLVRKIRSWKVNSFEWLEILFSNADFRPETMEQWSAIRRWRKDADSTLWKRIVILDSLKSLTVAGIRTADLLHGVPPNLEKFDINDLRMTHIPLVDFPRLEAKLEQLKLRDCYIEITISCSQSAVVANNLASQLEFWQQTKAASVLSVVYD